MRTRIGDAGSYSPIAAKRAAVVEHDGQVAGRAVVADRRDRPVEQPRVPATQLAHGVAGDADGDAR